MATVALNEDITKRADILNILDQHVVNTITEQPITPDHENVMTQVKNMLLNNIHTNMQSLSLQEQREELFKLLYFEPTNYKIYFLIGHLYSLENMRDLSKAFYRLSIFHKKDFIESFLNFGVLYHNVDNNKALNLLEYANNKIDKDDVRVANTLAVVYADTYRYEDAERILVTVINNPKTDSDTRLKSYSNVGVIVSSMGDNPRSLKYFRECNEKMPESNTSLPLIQNKLMIMNNVFISDIDDIFGKEYEAAGCKDGYEYIYKEHLKLTTLYKDVPKCSFERKSMFCKKIGYFLDSNTKITTRNMTELLNFYDQKIYEVYCYIAFDITDAIMLNSLNIIRSFGVHFRQVKSLARDLVVKTVVADRLDVMFYYGLDELGKHLHDLNIIKTQIQLGNPMMEIQDHKQFKEHIQSNDIFSKIQEKVPENVPEKVDDQKEIVVNEDIVTSINRLNNQLNPRILRIGYISSDFRNHVCAKFMYDILKSHDRSKFEIYCYYVWKVEDLISLELKKLDVNWRHMYQVSDTVIANKIVSDKIDILFDLGGHTDNNKMGVFAMKPAPIQMTYLGYPNTTGLKEIDYRIVDKITNPKNSNQKHVEKLIYKEDCFIHYNPFNYTQVGVPTIVPFNLDRCSATDIIIAAINRPAKNNSKLFGVWGRILKKVPNAKLMIKVKSRCDQDYIKKRYLDELDIPESRLIIMEFKTDNDSYFDLFNKFDILLDSFPYSGTTTTCDSLYMGVPVITMYNKDIHAHNVSTSIIVNMANENPQFPSIYDDMISSNEDEYVDKCVALVTNKERLNDYRKNLREMFLKSMSIEKFMPGFENILLNVSKTLY
jgi:predicted O-linked N-acetylglucosamine transferase (SPINDLY family)